MKLYDFSGDLPQNMDDWSLFCRELVCNDKPCSEYTVGKKAFHTLFVIIAFVLNDKSDTEFKSYICENCMEECGFWGNYTSDILTKSEVYKLEKIRKGNNYTFYTTKCIAPLNLRSTYCLLSLILKSTCDKGRDLMVSLEEVHWEDLNPGDVFMEHYVFDNVKNSQILETKLITFLRNASILMRKCSGDRPTKYNTLYRFKTIFLSDYYIKKIRDNYGKRFYKFLTPQPSWYLELSNQVKHRGENGGIIYI